MPTSVEERFWKFVKKTETCWLWLGSKDTAGYGKFWIDGSMRSAHRVAYELFIGPIPRDKDAAHQCDRRDCINPAHLFAATHAENMADMVQKNRAAVGERDGNSKATAEIVLEIRKRYAEDGGKAGVHRGATRANLARDYGLDWYTVHNIVTRRTWKHV